MIKMILHRTRHTFEPCGQIASFSTLIGCPWILLPVKTKPFLSQSWDSGDSQQDDAECNVARRNEEGSQLCKAEGNFKRTCTEESQLNSDDCNVMQHQDDGHLERSRRLLQLPSRKTTRRQRSSD